MSVSRRIDLPTVLSVEVLLLEAEVRINRGIRLRVVVEVAEHQVSQAVACVLRHGGAGAEIDAGVLRPGGGLRLFVPVDVGAELDRVLASTLVMFSVTA